MGFLDIWKKIFSKEKSIKTGFSINNAFLTSTFGKNVYESDIVIACIHAIAEETSKMIIRSVNTRDNRISDNNDDLNKLFKNKPNPLMTMKDLLYWTASRLEIASNAYWFPEVEIVTYSDGTRKERTVAIYPIDSTNESMSYNEKEGKYYIVFSMRNGSTYQAPYEYIIHFRKHFSSDNFFFGGVNRKELLKTLQSYTLIQDLIPRGVQASMQTKGILVAKSLTDIDGLKKFKREFEQSSIEGKSGISVIDVSGEFVPVNINPQIVDHNLMTYFDNKICKNFGVPISILLGNASENDWASFYQKNIEPFKIELEQACNAGLLSSERRNFGNEIRCYDRLVQHYTIATRLSIVKELGSRNYLSRSEQREILGFEPDGGPEKVSLNFVDSDKANEYQGVGGKENEGKDSKIIQSNTTGNEE